MKPHPRALLWLACLLLAACGKVHQHKAETLAAEAHVAVVEQGPGTTPFIAKLTLSLQNFADLQSVSYTVTPKPGTLSRPVGVTFTRSWLDRTGNYNNFYRQLTLPVFGLYANYHNDVDVTLTFRDGSNETQRVALDTPAYTDPAGAPYMTPTIRVARGAGPAPGTDFFALYNTATTPVIVDSDANLRWVGRGVDSSIATLFTGDGFYSASLAAPTLTRVNFDGTWVPVNFARADYADFHHQLTRGKTGLLAELDVVRNGSKEWETVLSEVTPDGQVIREWDMAAIFRDYMLAHGDDPSNFVRDGADWFHMNSAIYSPADDSLIVSSRENFVAKIDYQTGALKWLFGDNTKHWYVDYPSLRALALTLTAGKPPIGQHALSLTADGQLLLFNNGFGSLNQPGGTAPGQTRTFSTPSRYAIDEQARTAAEVWTFEHTPPIYSDLCSSVYETGAGNYLVSYAVAENRTRARVMAVDAAGNVAFDFDYPTNFCGTAFAAVPVDMAALTLN